MHENLNGARNKHCNALLRHGLTASNHAVSNNVMDTMMP
jgi:hypothetical protein